jgi:hypothetical protein
MSAAVFFAVGCSDADSDNHANANGNDGTNLAVDFQPGDPSFRRDPALDVTNISRAGERRSHNAGRNCLQCHQENGPGRGRFTIAGTAYDAAGKALTSGTIELRTAPAGKGDVVLAVAIDQNGNFFTTEAADFFKDGAPLFPAVRGEGDSVSSMPFPTRSGACNVCHAGSFRVTLGR